MLKRFSEISMRDVTTCGGKGASLGEMMSAGLPIPNGFVLTTNAYGKDSTEREKNVLQAFDKLDTKFVAVRSSGTKEDGVDDSFAGQFDTYLFVTRENLIEKIKECHDSVNSERIISYCDYKGIDRKSIKVAVVIQKMVNSDSAGVCFTVNPVSQNHDEIMIDAGFGVGEAVVSGMITPDNYIVNKKTGEIKKNISQQEKKLVLSDKGGTLEVEVIRDEQGKQKLSDENITKLSELAVKIEDHYGKPMDTERAVENGKLYMLQARPITTLGIKNKKEDSVVDHFLQNLKQEDIFAFRGKMSLIEIGVSRTDKFLIVQKGEELIQLISYGEIIERVNKEFEDYWNNKNSISNIKNKIEKVFKDIDTFREEFLTNDLSKITDEEIQKLAQNAYNLYTSLVYSTAQYDIFGRDTMLYCMNKGFFSIDEKTFILASKPREISFEHRWNRVLIKYLSEGIDNVSNIEYIFTNYWNTKSEKEIKDYLKTVSIEKLKNVEDEYDKELSKNNSEIEDWYNKQSDDVKKVADFGMVISGLKDMRKDYIGKMGSIIYHLDKEMCRRANIDKRGWAFISPKELCLGIIGLKNIKSDIEKRIDDGVVCFGGYNLDWIIEPCNYDSIINEIERKIPGLSHDDTNIIHGQIGSVGKGIVRGFVKVVLSPDNADFKKGDILVTSMTRPEFLPLMKNAKAVITNEGGITCHAAIVSRELGIPCIIGTKNATQILKDGDLVEVDADNGVVRILDNGEKDNLKLEILGKTYTPEFWQNPEVFFNYQGVPFYTSVFAKCYSLPESNRSTPAYYVSEFKEGGTIIQYCAGNFVEKGYNIINDLLEGKTEGSEFLAENDKRIVDCFEKCKKYINSGEANFIDIWRQIEKAFANGWHIFNFSHALQDYLNKLKENDISLYQILSNNIVAPEKTFINKAGDYLKKIVNKYSNDFDIVYKNFMKEYGRFQNSYLGVNKNITKEWLKNYYESLLEIKNNESEKVLVTNIPEKYKSLVDVAGKAIIYQDNKKKLGLIAYEIMDRRLLSVSMKTGIPFEDFLWLTVDEILSYNLDSEDSINELKKKLLKYKNSGVRRGIMIDNGYIDIDKEFWDKVVEINSIKSELNEIKGIVGNKGRIVGRAKIVLSIKKDGYKLESGDILVTGMTRPEFLPLMQKASAFITDEGGITCHAAIVSRELGKPCIIGTKIATQVLKDGDLVEVDADNGVVRILDSVSIGGETKNIQTKPCDKENLVDEFISSLTHKENLLPPITTSSIFVQGSIELYAKHMPDYVKDNASMNGLTIYRGGETYTYVDSTKIINIANTVVQLFFSKKLTQDDIFRRFNQYTNQIEKSYKLYTHNYLKNLSNEKLFDLAKGLINSFMEFDATSLFAIVIDEKFLQNHSSIIKGLSNLPKDFYKNASNIPVISFDKQQKKDVIDCLENGGFSKENLEKLQYLGTSYSRYLSVENMKKFILENYQTDNLSIERDMIDKEDENLEKAKTIYNKWYKSLTSQQQLIASFIYTSINLRDKRKNFTLKALCTISRIMEEFFVKNGLNKKYLWNIGFGEILEGPEYIISLKKRLGMREKGSVFFSDYNKQKLFIQEGSECFEVAFEKMKSLYDTDISDNIIQGFSGSPGRVQGTVKIVQFLDKKNNFKKGDILVTGMTRPEFVPLMKKASAIVTDEGGITCHAAIVSRELGIPCVIGTKIATQALKDGDLVDVDADNGVVRILETKNENQTDLFSENSKLVKINKFSVDEFVYSMGKGKESDIKVIEEFLNNSDWDVQRFNASPVFVNPTGMGNNYIFQKYFGISYSGFFFNYRGHQWEMGYNLKDFDRLREKLGYSYLQPGFVGKVAKDYYDTFSYFEKFFEKIDNGLKIDENNIIKLLKMVNRAQCYSVGIAHSTELINYICTYKLKPLLEKEIGEENLKEIENKIFVADKLSFFAVEHNELYKIAIMKKGEKQGKKLIEHTQKWNRMQNSYVGAKNVDVEFFENRMEKVLQEGEIQLDVEQRDKLIDFLMISDEYKNIIRLINFTTSWHDNRKANILRTIGYFDCILKKLSLISKISFDDLLYLSFSDIDGLNDLEDLIKMGEELKQRREGVIYILNDLKEYIYTKDDYLKLNGILENLYAEQNVKEIKGSTANKGNVKGKVRICNSMEKIREFKEGEILVASMTRPEYISAIKKSIAIITDEGGITCHAAIVSRELGKPCIIGTKIATQVLKDGDLVEVDADNGIVKIL